MLARFFIDRPVFAWVISIVIVGAGIIAGLILPIAQYPEIAPPTVSVTCSYPGASARVVQETVAAPIEQQVNGVENMMYMSSQSANDGSYTLTVTFELGTDLNMAQVLVQNRVALATPTLPDVVKTTGVSVKKKSPSILLVVNLYSEDDESGKPIFDQLYLSNYATIQVRDALARVKGVGDVGMLGQQDYSMRIWLDPDKLSSQDLTALDVVNALKEQNVQVAAGQIGQPPVPAGLDFQYTITTLGRLVDVEQFGNIIIKTEESKGGKSTPVVYLNEVARIELGARNQDTRCRLDGRPSVGLAMFQLPGSNALETADNIRKAMKDLERRFPNGLKYAIVYDTTPFIEESVAEVFKTLRDAVILVAIVVLLFLQDWKSMILPLIDVGVSLVGTCAVMLMMGFNLNNLTLFGLVLAIGIVVDDAIVVLENIERWLAKGLPVREATIEAMTEITGPIIAITLVLSSVFLPSAFLGGITGQFFRQFALTISASMLISAVNAMTLTPARATDIFGHRQPGHHGQHVGEALPRWGIAILLGLATWWLAAYFFGEALGYPKAAEHGEPVVHQVTPMEWTLRVAAFIPGAVLGWLIARYVNGALAIFFRGFNAVFDFVTRVYGQIVAWFLRLAVIVLIIYGGLLYGTYYGFTHVPTGFIPPQDKGYLLTDIRLPDSSSLERTVATVAHLEKIVRETEGVEHTMAIPGQSFVLNAVSSNFGAMFIILKPFHERHDPHLNADVIAMKVRQRVAREIPEAVIAVFGAPAVDGLGNAGGFKLMVEDRGDLGLEALQAASDAVAAEGSRQPGMAGVFNSFRSTAPQLYANVDRTKCKTLQVPLNDVFMTLQVLLGSYYTNDFNRFGRTWQVNIQADAPYRIDAETIQRFKVRNLSGEMVPLGTLLDISDSTGPIMINRYNTYPAAPINGASLPGVATGTVLSNMENVSARVLPDAMAMEWTELSYLQKQSARIESFRDLLQNPLTAFVGAVVLVFLVLAAQYESWSMPAAIILVVPMCLLSAIVGIAMSRMDLNIFVQIGFVVLVGLASKNAILVVEFARERHRQGVPIFEAAVEASTTRLRPIIMTSFAFILGVLPLMIAKGAGAEMRRTLGTAVFSGMLGVTLFGIFLTPVFYYVIARLTGEESPTPPPQPPQSPQPHH